MHDNILQKIELLENRINKNSKKLRQMDIDLQQVKRTPNRVRSNIKNPGFFFGNTHNFDKNKPVFIHIPKTAGRRIASHFKPSLNYFTHLPISQIYDNLGIDVDTCFKFCFIRNPYSRFISAFNFAHLNDVYCVNDFCEIFFKSKLDWLFAYKTPIQHAEHFLSQKFFITIDNEIKVDKIYQYEKMTDAMKDLYDRGLEPAKTFKVKYGISNNWQRELNKENQKLIENAYSEDFELYESIKNA